MKKKHYLILRGATFAVLALVFIITPLYAAEVVMPLPVIIGFAAFFTGLSFWYFRQLKKPGSDGEKPFYPSPATDASPKEKMTYFKLMMYMSMVVFPLLIIITIQDLNDLESGRVQEINTWEPFVLLYESWGYWAPIVFLVVLGGLVIIGFLWHIKRTARIAAEKSA